MKYKFDLLIEGRLATLAQSALAAGMIGMTAPQMKADPIRPPIVQQSAFMNQLLSYIYRNEGVRLKPYKDSKGNLTIGIGHVILPNEKFTQITEDEAIDLFKRDVIKHLNRTKHLFPKFDTFPTNTKLALVDGVYRGDLSGSSKTIKLINQGNWKAAAKEYLNHDEYINTKYSGIKKRMKRNATNIANTK